MASPLTEEERLTALVAAAIQDELTRRAAIRPWRLIARPGEQIPPEDIPWLVWLYLAGRGTGKTRSAAERVCEWATETPGSRGALVGRTPADVRDVMIEGESGILACSLPGEVPVYEPTKRRLTWPNGSIATAYSAEVPSALRGPQHHWAWADEVAAWSDAPKGDVVDTAWNNLMLGLRLGQNPQCAVTTTPKPNKLIKAILGHGSTVVTKGTTYANLANLAPAFREQVLATYEGTRIGRQELMGELLDDVEGALWGLSMIENHRITLDQLPDMRRVVVGVDPSGGSGPANDEQGIVVAGIGVDGEFYVLDDKSCKLSPHGWGSRAVAGYEQWSGDRIVAERNYGGEMVLSTIKQVDPTVPVKLVSASRGKAVRAEPIAALYEQGRVHHVGSFPQLEDELTSWTPFEQAKRDSPNRLDALVWALTELAFKGGSGQAFLAHWRRQQEDAAAAAAVEGLLLGEDTERTDVVDTLGRAVRSIRETPRSARDWREIAAEVKARRAGGQPNTREDASR